MTRIIRWEPPEDELRRRVRREGRACVRAWPAPRRHARGLTDNPGEPGADMTWEYQPICEAPPPAPKGQWWAGWLPDPRGRHEFRYWDGSNWTDHVADSGLAGIDPV